MIYVKTFEGIFGFLKRKKSHPVDLNSQTELLFHKIEDDDLDKWVESSGPNSTHQVDEFSKSELVAIGSKFSDLSDLYVGMIYTDKNTLSLHRSKDNFLTKKYMIKIESIEDMDLRVGGYPIYKISINTNPSFDIRKYNDEWFVITCRHTNFLCDSINGVFQFIDQKIWKYHTGM